MLFKVKLFGCQPQGRLIACKMFTLHIQGCKEPSAEESRIRNRIQCNISAYEGGEADCECPLTK